MFVSSLHAFVLPIYMPLKISYSMKGVTATFNLAGDLTTWHCFMKLSKMFGVLIKCD
jgi:hypothetical protein